MGASSRMSTLFVGNLAWGSTSESLSAHLGAFGSVVSCDTGDVRNGRARGWAIVTMGSEGEAQAAIAGCHDVEFEGRPLAVRLDEKPQGEARGGGGRGARPAGGGDPSLDGKVENSSGLQVVVRNLPWSVTSEMLRGTFEQIGTVVAAEVIFHADSGRSNGWGTVRFSKPEEAADAVARFGGVELAGRPMTV